MLLALTWAALRRRPFSVLCTFVLVVISASLLRVPVPAALVAWVLTAFFVLEVWLALEPLVLEYLGCRELTRGEHERMALWMRRFKITIRVVGDSVPWLGHGLRTVVVSDAALDLFEDRTLVGLLAQTAARQQSPIVLREVVVWLGLAPIVLAWFVGRWIAHLGKVPAFAIGTALVLPVLLGLEAFVRRVGRLLGVLIVGLLGAVLLSSGFAAAGLGLWLGWPLVTGLRALLAWESRGAEADADLAAVRASYGWHLLEGLDALTEIDPPRPSGPRRLLVRPGAPVPRRASRVKKALGITT